jgi:hypothetical protein
VRARDERSAARADSAREERSAARADNARDDLSAARADNARDDLSAARADCSAARAVNARELNALVDALSSNAADMTSSHALRDILMTDFSPTPAERSTPESDGARSRCPNFTVFGKENFTKNIKGKVTVIVNKCESNVAANSGQIRPVGRASLAGGRRKEAFRPHCPPAELIPLGFSRADREAKDCELSLFLGFRC